MPIDSLCKACGRTLRVDDSLSGRKARCPVCGNIYDVPIRDSAQPTVASIQPMASPLGSGKLADSWENYESLQETQAYRPVATPLASVQEASIQELRPLEPVPSDPGIPADDASFPAQVAREQFLVKVPSGQVFGPADEATIREWASQGRVNETCDVRPVSVEVWMGYDAWSQQQTARRRIHTAPDRSASVANIFGTNLGEANRPQNQSPVMLPGQGVLILCLGVVSWILCSTIVGAPVLSIVTIVMANSELKKINEGRSPAQDKTLVYIGLWAAIVNLVACVAVFMVLVVLAAINA